MEKATYDDFLKGLDTIFLKEGGAKYTDLAADYGGKTRWGITEKTARAWGYKGDMKGLSKDVAESIYYKGYWVASGAEIVYPVSEIVAHELMDIAVNLSPNRSAGWLQRGLNMLNMNSRLGEDLKLDSVIGPKTIGMLRKLSRRDEWVLYVTLNMQQAGHYMAQALSDNRQRTFFSGWVLQRVTQDILSTAKKRKLV